MRFELDYAFKLDHWKHQKPVEQERNQGNADEAPTPRGRDLLNQIERKAALISRSDIFFDLLPRDRKLDPLVAEAAKAAMRWEIYHPEKGYQDVRDIMVLGSLAARMWGAAVDFDPSLGPFGEITFRNLHGTDVAWSPGFHSPHHPACRAVWEQALVPIEDIRRIPDWDSKDLEPDGPDSGETGGPIDIRGNFERDRELDGLVRVVKLWERGVLETKKTDTTRRLTPGERHMACLNCGFRGPRQETQDSALPLSQPNACPDCGEDLLRIDAELKSVEELAFEKGKRLTIFAPNQMRILRKTVWPYGLRTVPYCVWQSKPHPGEQIGQSETLSNMSMQTSSNVLLAEAIDTMRRAKTVHAVPRGVLEDPAGEEWERGRNQGAWAYYNQDMPPSGIITMTGAQLPPGWNAVFQAVQGVFQASRGSPDLGLTPSQSKDIAVGTVRAIIESGELPVDHQIERLRRAEAPWFGGAVYQLIRATYTPERIRRIESEDGNWELLSVAGLGLPDLDVQIIASPSVIRLTQAEIQTLIEFAAAPPHMRRFLARKMNIPISEVIELENEERRIMSDPALGMAAQGGSAANGAGGANGTVGNSNTLPVATQRRLGGATHGAL